MTNLRRRSLYPALGVQGYPHGFCPGLAAGLSSRISNSSDWVSRTATGSRVYCLSHFLLGSAADPVVLRQWTLSKELGKGKLPLQNEMIALEPWRKVQLTHDITTTSFMVTISRFVPGPSDVTAWKWTDANGNRREYELPPYYISDVVEATENLRQYLPKAREDFPRALLVNSNSIVWKTFKEAERFYKASGVSPPWSHHHPPASNRIPCLERASRDCLNFLVGNADARKILAHLRDGHAWSPPNGARHRPLSTQSVDRGNPRHANHGHPT